MALRTKGKYERELPADELISILIHNLNQLLNLYVSAESALFEEEYDAKYNEFGNPRSYPNPYPGDLAEAEKKLRESADRLRRFAPILDHSATFPSFAVAEELVQACKAKNPARPMRVYTEQRNGLSYLLVGDGAEDAAVIDIDIAIGADSQRHLLEDQKTLSGTTYPLYSFLTEEQKKDYAFFKEILDRLAKQADEEA